MMFSASSNEYSTIGSWLEVFRRFSRSSSRFSVSSSVVWAIIFWNWGFRVRTVTSAGVVAEPVMSEKVALLGPCVSHVW